MTNRNWLQWLKLTGVPAKRAARHESRQPRIAVARQPENLEGRALLSASPFVQSIVRETPTTQYTNDSSVSYLATFNTAVTGVDSTDFLVATNGNLRAAAPVLVAGSNATYTVTVNGIHGAGDLSLELVDNDSIQDGSLVPLGGFGAGNGSFQGPIYTVDQVFPHVVSITGTTPGGLATQGPSVSYMVTFSEAVTGVVAKDFAVATTGSVTVGTPLFITGSGAVYTVTVNGVAGTGTLALNLVDNGAIRDLDGNPLTQVVQAASFQNQTTFTAGNRPESVASADLNGDGIPDLVVSPDSDPDVGVLLGNGNGTFRDQVTVGTGQHPRSINIADVNGDGVPDLIIANYGENSVSVLVGNGDGTFRNQTTFAIDSPALASAVVDLNGDGKLDIVVANRNTNDISVLLGNGNGTFQNQLTFTTGAQPSSISVKDFNQDGDPDIVVANLGSTPQNVTLLLGNGDGTFQNQVTFSASQFPEPDAVADVNGDGHADFVIAGFAFGQNDYAVYGGFGTATFQISPSPSDFANTVKLRDVNGDGVLDIVGNSQFGAVLLGNGNGTFQHLSTFAVGANPSSIEVADVNGDGKPDLVTAFDYDVRVSLGDFNGNFAGDIYNVTLPPTHLVFTQIPGSATAGVALSPAVQVAVENQSNNVVTSDNSTVTLTVLTGLGGFTTGSTTTVTAVNGIATFNNLALTTAVTYTFSASDSRSDAFVVTDGSSGNVSISPAASSQLVFTRIPGSGTAGQSLSPIVQIAIEDQFGNVVTTDTSTVSLSVLSGPGAFSNSSTLNVAAVNGVATFSNLFLNTSGRYTLSANAGSLSAGRSGQIVISPAQATGVTVGIQPAAVGTPVNVTVTARDAFGNITTGYTGTVHFTSSDKKALLPANYTFSSPDAGQHTFSVIFQNAKSQTITATETQHPLIKGTGSIVVAASLAIQSGQAKTVTFWRSTQGQNLLKSFNGGSTSTTLGDWLATTLPNLFGNQTGTSNLAGKTNAEVAEFYFALPRGAGLTLEVDVLTAALNVYATTTSLGGPAGTAFGFKVNAGGFGASLQNVGASGAAFGVPNNTLLTINQILSQANTLLPTVVLTNSNSRLRSLADTIFIKIS